MSDVLEVSGLRVELAHGAGVIVDEVDLTIAAGEVLGLVGESGSGKTTLATALLGSARRGARIVGGSVRIEGVDVLALREPELRRLRGRTVSYVPQDPSAALNPAMRVGRQLRELIRVHRAAAGRAEETVMIERGLAEVGLGSERIADRYPHQLSGGQQQRVCIAMAFLLRPRLIVMDEPTTGLDVTTQAHVIATIRELCRSHDVAALYVSHDLAVVGELAHRALVMYAGGAVEIGPAAAVLTRPRHPYTVKLLEALPDLHDRRRLVTIPGGAPRPGARPAGCAFASRCELALPQCREQRPMRETIAAGWVVRCHRARELPRPPRTPGRSPSPTQERSSPALEVEHLCVSYGDRAVVRDVSLQLRPLECLALVGESGSGKTTLSRAIVGLAAPASGSIRLEGERLSRSVAERSHAARRALQYVFQSPFNSLNPRKPVGEILATPLRQFFPLDRRQIVQRSVDALARVELTDGVLVRYPQELSGGERQRVAIARALACEPAVLICDEITSALDVSVQAAIVELLRELQQTQRLAVLFVTHDLALVRAMADRVAVMRAGQIVETGPSEQVFAAPRDAYTQALLSDTPRLSVATA